MKKYLASLFLTTQIFAFAGIGVYGNSDMFSVTPAATSNSMPEVTVTPQSFDNASGVGLFFYLDVLPIVDLEANIELVGNTYKFTTSLAPAAPGEFPWGRVSGYLTLRKKLMGIGVPFLAKFQVNGGLGYNIHTVTPNVTVAFIENAFASMPLEDAASQNFGQDAIIDSLVEYMSDNAINTSGFHIQLGAQAKLLMFNLFATARYTIAEDVIDGQTGFPSAWAGLAFGF
tara:strand:- start:556 stop:1242 length:687 start_codon:yes stop_codon:yes gene_type:complete